MRFEAKELFVRKTKLISESTEKIIEFHDLIKEIEDEDKKMNYISSPKFKLAGVDFSINVLPDCIANNVPGFLCFYLKNYGDEDQTTSVAVKNGPGVDLSWKMRKVEAQEIGVFRFISHETYRQWAKDHGDVLRLEVVVTVHSKAEGDVWTR